MPEEPKDIISLWEAGDAPTPPSTHILYTGPKEWQTLPSGSLFWHDEGKWHDNNGTSIVAIPGKRNRYAVPVNLELPPSDPQPDILEEARQLIHKDRAADYGEAKASFTRIAQLWSVYKGVEITPKDVASMMILLKMSRSVTSNKRDNWLDTIGYAALGSELE